MTIILMRHGETEWNRQKRIQGKQPVGLNQNGIRQVEAACAELQGLYPDISVIVTSPVRRARQSAEICAKHFQVPIYVLNQFSERSFGDLEGKTIEELQHDYHISDIESLVGIRWGVESTFALRSRIFQGLDILESRFHGRKILVVTHGSVIRLVKETLGFDKDMIENCGFFVIPNR